MKVRDILEHFLAQAEWVDRNRTVDRVIVGDPETEADRCLVTWMPSGNALREAVARGIRLIICHEPTFWNHHDNLAETRFPGLQTKHDYILEHGLVVLRNHDCWDRWPELGIPWAWARFLGLGNRPAGVSPNRYQHRYDVEPMPLDALARRVAQRCAGLGEPFVQVTGNPSATVSRIGIGTGCCADLPTFRDMGCDCSIVCDDGSCYWSNIQWAEDLGHPVIRVNHGTSEEPGMATLTDYINNHLSGLRAEHLPHGSVFRLVGGNPAW